MRIRSVLVGLLAIILVVVAADAGLAQHVGFQTAGIPQPGIQQGTQQHRPAFPPVHTPVAPVRGTFGATVPAIIVVPAHGIAHIPLVPNFPTVIVPNPVLVPGQTFFPGTINPTPFVPVVQPFQPLYPLMGMPRADVLRHFGQPSVTVITSTGETLYFTGGVTVIIQNGLVVGPR